MNIEQLNKIDFITFKEKFMSCCGSQNWVKAMFEQRPFNSLDQLCVISDDLWQKCSDDDVKEAISHHPQIGDMESLKKKFSQKSNWSKSEQSGVDQADEKTIKKLRDFNIEYQEKYSFIFLICATGKSAAFMLAQLMERIKNSPEQEIKNAKAEQGKITKLRLEKLLS